MGAPTNSGARGPPTAKSGPGQMEEILVIISITKVTLITLIGSQGLNKQARLKVEP